MRLLLGLFVHGLAIRPSQPHIVFHAHSSGTEVAFALRKRLLHYTRHAAPNLERNTSCGRLQLRAVVDRPMVFGWAPGAPERQLISRGAKESPPRERNMAACRGNAGPTNRRSHRPLKAATRFVHKSAPISPLLQVLAPLIRGFQEPLGEVQKKLLMDTLLPLHKPNEWLLWDRQTPLISLYHKELTHCVLLVLEKEPGLSCRCMQAICSYLPQAHESNTPKEVLLLHELAEILKVMKVEDLRGCMSQLVGHMVRLLGSHNSQTLQSVLQFWKDERVAELLGNFADEMAGVGNFLMVVFSSM
ncbi:unnamed protein product [Effrenium voratum]|nr:unnamed protein product [Effrenium voratum]